MSSIFIAIINVGGSILALVILGIIIIAIIRAARTGGLSKNDKDSRDEETRMIQDIYNALPKMEERIEALETILIERGHQNR
ncbi:phage-shock protein [Desulfobacter hydrogenophilus]|uniref:Phage-shock protein n=1 Tax=Desulfobacter hydrogenophilus TaxID=2291 RepID=A0A328F8H9_9BACT|nr:phage-shock protein [Desulfobacter hydrogenophilus]NDY73731.1 phage-shock protein [Desulfobacter hydrogenophilus]QBH11528.1 phage-shock protein [Desulfobacter hydrogenophilus]RAM00516.1 phage-shock protein [Desulfobacter hydrogenophilus]